MRKPTGGPAASVIIGYNHFQQAQYSKGLTKRDYFAAMAMQGMFANGQQIEGDSNGVKRAKFAYIVADAMLAERNKGE